MTLLTAINARRTSASRCFVHVAGAMMLVGTLIFRCCGTAARPTVPTGAPGFTLTALRLRAVLIGVFPPAYIVIRIGAQWTESAVKFPYGYWRPGSTSATWSLTSVAALLVSVILA